MACFDPRSRAGSDAVLCGQHSFMDVSIHAPARGATQYADIIGLRYDVSIHAPARGATYVTLTIAGFMWFRSTLPRGERLSRDRVDAYPICFDPRSRAGSDVKVTPPFEIYYVSIHAPARGATTNFDRLEHRSPVSIHAPARGATGRPLAVYPTQGCFDPRSRAGSDQRCWHSQPR